jgi:hypothetical protein
MCAIVSVLLYSCRSRCTSYLFFSLVVFVFQEGLKPPVLVFVQSKGRAKELFSELVYDGINVDVIHSERSKKQRDDVVKQFRLGSIWVLIATDLMARGVDFKGVNMVCCGASRARPHISSQCTLDAPGPSSHDIISCALCAPCLLLLLPTSSQFDLNRSNTAVVVHMVLFFFHRRPCDHATSHSQRTFQTCLVSCWLAFLLSSPQQTHPPPPPTHTHIQSRTHEHGARLSTMTSLPAPWTTSTALVELDALAARGVL